MKPADTLIAYPPLTNGPPRPSALGVTCALIAFAIACGGGGASTPSSRRSIAPEPREIGLIPG